MFARKRRMIDRSPRYHHLREDDNLVHVLWSRQGAFEGRYQDLSRTGLRFRARHPEGLREDDEIEIAIPAPGIHEPGHPGEIKARGVIVRIMGDQDYSVRFVQMPDESQALLRDSLRAGFKRAAHEAFVRPFRVVLEFLVDRGIVLLILAFAIAIAWAGMKWIMAPHGNYRPDTTIPWGDRTFLAAKRAASIAATKATGRRSPDGSDVSAGPGQ